MDMSSYTGSNYITAESLEPGVRIEARILAVNVRDFEDGEKPVIYLDYQAKAVVLNPTRAKVLYGAYGPESGNWIGKLIAIYRGETTYAGKKTPCVEVEAVDGPKIAAQSRRQALGDGPVMHTEDGPITEVPDGPGDGGGDCPI